MTYDLGNDLLLGAKPIAEFVFGDRREARRVYHLAQKEGAPIFKLGGTICARRSALLDWITVQEKTATGKSVTAA